MVLEHFEKSWKVYEKNYVNLIIALLLYVAIVSVAFVAFVLLIPVNIISSLLVGIIGFVTYSVLIGGYTRVVYDSIKGKSDWRTIFKYSNRSWVDFTAVNILAIIIMLLIFSPAVFLVYAFVVTKALIFLLLAIIAVIFGIFSSVLLYFSVYAVAINNLKPIDAIKKSVKIIMSNYLEMLIMLFVSFIIAFVVGMIPILGIFISIFVVSPYLSIVYVSFYVSKQRRR